VFSEDGCPRGKARKHLRAFLCGSFHAGVNELIGNLRFPMKAFLDFKQFPEGW
jgi:hypothetical protein